MSMKRGRPGYVSRIDVSKSFHSLERPFEPSTSSNVGAWEPDKTPRLRLRPHPRFPSRRVHLHRRQARCRVRPSADRPRMRRGRCGRRRRLADIRLCMSFPALSALVAGYEVFCFVDASGNWSKMATDLTIARVAQAGAILRRARRNHEHITPPRCDRFRAGHGRPYRPALPGAHRELRQSPERAKSRAGDQTRPPRRRPGEEVTALVELKALNDATLATSLAEHFTKTS